MQKKVSKKAEHSILFHGVKIHYGIGGLHACTATGIYETTTTKEVIDVDVAGYYMNAVAKHGRKEKIYPQHLGVKFIDVVDDIIAERAKYPKGTSINNGLKLAGNGGIFGAAKDKFTPIYDLLYFLKIVVGCQFMILKLIEDIVLAIPSITIIQVNTDGITVLIDKDKKELFYQVCKEWETYTYMVLEYVTYSKMWIRDVNNYVALSTNGKVKLKGAYEIEKELHKNNSMKIVKIAAIKNLLENIPVEKTIREHDNILDFCKRFKATSGWIVEYHYIKDYKEQIDILSKNIRYYVSTNGGTLYKKKITNIVEKTREDMDTLFKQGMLFFEDEDIKIKSKTQFIGIDAGKNITLFNRRFNVPMKDYKIDYKYYIEQTYDLISCFKTKQLNLF